MDRKKEIPITIDCPGSVDEREIRYAPYREKVRREDKREC